MCILSNYWIFVHTTSQHTHSHSHTSNGFLKKKTITTVATAATATTLVVVMVVRQMDSPSLKYLLSFILKYYWNSIVSARWCILYVYTFVCVCVLLGMCMCACACICNGWWVMLAQHTLLCISLGYSTFFKYFSSLCFSPMLVSTIVSYTEMKKKKKPSTAFNTCRYYIHYRWSNFSRGYI